MATFCEGIIENIDKSECIGNSLVTINENFSGLEEAGCNVETEVARLLTLINELSSNMKNIGNYPYLEFAWVGNPSDPVQTFVKNVETVLNLGSEIADTGGFGSVSGNNFTLAAGTYQFTIYTPVKLDATTSITPAGILSLKTTGGQYITRQRVECVKDTETSFMFIDSTQMKLTTQTTFDIRILSSVNGSVGRTPNPAFSSTSSGQDQRTTIKLWKVG